jgi:ubiquinone/menaquinone biosynthesis C-methylase UbiE
MKKDILGYYAKTNTEYLHPKGKKATVLLWEALECKRNERILELGFGTGATICLFASMAKDSNFYGIEHSELMFKKGKSRVTLCKAGNVALFLSEEPYKLPFEDGFFDGIYVESVLAIQPAENLEMIIMELHRVLKPGGKLIANEGIWTGSTTEKEIADINGFCISNFGIIQANAKYPYIHDWIKLLESNGLKLKNFESLKSGTNAKKMREPLLKSMASKLYSWYGRLKSMTYVIEYYNYRKSMKILNSGNKFLEGYLICCRKEK